MSPTCCWRGDWRAVLKWLFAFRWERALGRCPAVADGESAAWYVGLAAGLGLAAGIVALLPRLMVSEPAMLVEVGSAATNFHLDGRVFLLAGSLALVAMLLLALIPLKQVARPQLLPVLQAGAATRTTGRMPIARRAAIWLQIAVSFALLVSTAALVRSFLNTRMQPSD